MDWISDWWEGLKEWCAEHPILTIIFLVLAPFIGLEWWFVSELGWGNAFLLTCLLVLLASLDHIAIIVYGFVTALLLVLTAPLLNELFTPEFGGAVLVRLIDYVSQHELLELAMLSLLFFFPIVLLWRVIRTMQQTGEQKVEHEGV